MKKLLLSLRHVVSWTQVREIAVVTNIFKEFDFSRMIEQFLNDCTKLAWNFFEDPYKSAKSEKRDHGPKTTQWPDKD